MQVVLHRPERRRVPAAAGTTRVVHPVPARAVRRPAVVHRAGPVAAHLLDARVHRRDKRHGPNDARRKDEGDGAEDRIPVGQPHLVECDAEAANGPLSRWWNRKERQCLKAHRKAAKEEEGPLQHSLYRPLDGLLPRSVFQPLSERLEPKELHLGIVLHLVAGGGVCDEL